jgi:Tol biopolymer transport system component
MSKYIINILLIMLCLLFFGCTEDIPDKIDKSLLPVESGIIASSSMIAFASILDGDYEIYLMKTDGSGIKQLTYNSAQDTEPAWSPNGQYITFSSDRDGSSAWDSDIFIMHSDGTGITNLTKTLAVNEYSSFWSYDSKKIAFWSDAGGFEDYYVMNVDGTGIKLMDEEYLDFALPGEYGDYYIYEAFNGNYDILLDFFDNPKGAVNLTNNIANDRYPSWSPDGKKIVFVSDRDFNNEIYIMNADGTNQTRITRNSVDDNYPAWSPF